MGIVQIILSLHGVAGALCILGSLILWPIIGYVYLRKWLQKAK